MAIICRRQHHLKWLEPEDVEAGFLQCHVILQCVGPIDCTHIFFDLSAHASYTDWYDKDYNYPMILQAIIDSIRRFSNVFARFSWLIMMQEFWVGQNIVS